MLRRLLDLLGSVVPAILLAVVLLAVGADVVARTLFRQSLHGSHDLAIVALAGTVWFGIIGTAVGGQLFGVGFVVDRLPARLRPAVQAFVHLAVIVVAAAVLRAAVAQVQTARFTTFLSLGWPKWIVSAALGVAMAAVILVQIMQLVELVRRRAR